MSELLLSPISKRQLADLQNDPAQAMLLSGPAGSGKRRVAEWLIETILELADGSFSAYAYGLIIRPEKESIGIEPIRQLEQFFSLKVPSPKPFNRAVLIEDGHYLTREAQNALLKILEEPPHGTLIVVTAANPQALLPTVRSRLTAIDLKPPAASELKDFFGRQQIDDQLIDRAYAISGGRPGLMQTMLEQPDHPLMSAAALARQLLKQNLYERLCMIDELAKQPSVVKDLLFILQQMAHLSLKTADGANSNRWRQIMAASYQAAEAIDKNAQLKLVLTVLMLNL